MKLNSNNQGTALLATMMVLATVGTITGVAINMTNNQGRLTRSSADYAKAIAVADSQLERLYSDWRSRMGQLPVGAKLTQTELDLLTANKPGSMATVHPGFADISGEFLANWPNANGQNTQTYRIQEVDAYGNTVLFDPNDRSTYSISTGPLPGFEGLFSINHTYYARLSVRVNSIGKSAPTASVARTFTRSEAPVFQAAIYYEDDIELHPGESMYLSGPMISNHRIYATVLNGKTLTFASTVSATKEPDAIVSGSSYANRPKYMPDGVTENPDYNTDRYNPELPPLTVYNAADYHAPDYTVSLAKQLKFSERLEPSGRDVRDAFDITDGSTTSLSQNNDGFRELIEKPAGTKTSTGFQGGPGYASDPDAIESVRFYNQAGLKVNVNGGTVTATYRDDTAVSAAVLLKVQAAILGRGDIDDKREASTVKVTRVDVAKLGEAIDLMNSSGTGVTKFNGIVYFSDDTTGMPATEKWAFRLENAAKLPTAAADVEEPSSRRGFTVATAGGVYLKGNYNTDVTNPPVPTAVLADAVMFLSNNWTDANAANPIAGTLNATTQLMDYSVGRYATETSYQVAVMAGTIPSGYVNTTTGVTYGSGGGAHNFPRLLERWRTQPTPANPNGTNINMNFKGSMVQLFTSKMFKGAWGTGEIYSPPNRVWSYNEDFTRHPSPGLFSFTFFTRGPWRRE